MDNILKFKNSCRLLYSFFSILLLIIPIYYAGYWLLINEIPSSLVNVNIESTSLIRNVLSLKLKTIGFIASLPVLFSLFTVVKSLQKLFSLYKEGEIFSFKHVKLFKKCATSLLLWVIFSILYESSKSVIFSISNPPGERILTLGISSSEITTILVGVTVFVLAWVMDEGRVLNEEIKLTV